MEETVFRSTAIFPPGRQMPMRFGPVDRDGAVGVGWDWPCGGRDGL